MAGRKRPFLLTRQPLADVCEVGGAYWAVIVAAAVSELCMANRGIACLQENCLPTNRNMWYAITSSRDHITCAHLKSAPSGQFMWAHQAVQASNPNPPTCFPLPHTTGSDISSQWHGR